MNKKFLLVVFLSIGIVTIAIITQIHPRNIPQPSDKISVATSFYPLAYLAQQIGGSYVSVINITPAGVEPHDFEPTPRDINNIYKSQLFIFNGGGIDSWAEKIQPNLEAQGIKTINMLSEAKRQSPILESTNPHLWLDPTIMSQEADMVTDLLIRIDSAHAQEYNSNREKLKKELAKLDTEYQLGLSNCQLREIITSHDAFGYLAVRYNFKIASILGISPEEEPSPKKIAEISALAKSKGVKYIFFETMVSPKLSETIASEIGAKTLVLDPIEGLPEQDSKDNQNYLTLMQQNLANLETAMLWQPNQSSK